MLSFFAHCSSSAAKVSYCWQRLISLTHRSENLIEYNALISLYFVRFATNFGSVIYFLKIELLNSALHKRLSLGLLKDTQNTCELNDLDSGLKKPEEVSRGTFTL